MVSLAMKYETKEFDSIAEDARTKLVTVEAITAILGRIVDSRRDIREEVVNIINKLATYGQLFVVRQMHKVV
jgi:hypothetical protein